MKIENRKLNRFQFEVEKEKTSNAFRVKHFWSQFLTQQNNNNKKIALKAFDGENVCLLSHFNESVGIQIKN